MTVHQLTRSQARRIAVRAQLLAAPRPTEMLDVVRRLGSVQIDLTNAVAPSPELVMWGRLGSSYPLGGLGELFASREVVELHGRILAAEDIALYRAELDDWGRHPRVAWQEETADWVDANDLCRREILDRLADEAPLPAAAFDDSCAVPWRSTFVLGTNGAAVTARPAGLRPEADGGDLRVRRRCRCVMCRS